MKLTEENVNPYSFKDVSFSTGVRYLPAVYIDSGEEFDDIDLKKQILENQEIVLSFQLYLDVIKQWTPRDDVTAFHIRKLEEILGVK